MSIYIIVEVITMLFGSSSNKNWGVIYFVNQSVLIIGLCLFLLDFFNNILIKIIISLSIVKILYNCLILVNETIADWVNGSYYVGFAIVVFILALILTRKR